MGISSARVPSWCIPPRAPWLSARPAPILPRVRLLDCQDPSSQRRPIHPVTLSLVLQDVGHLDNIKAQALNLQQFVEGRRWCPWAREGLEEARVFAGDKALQRRGDTPRLR